MLGVYLVAVFAFFTFSVGLKFLFLDVLVGLVVVHSYEFYIYF